MVYELTTDIASEAIYLANDIAYLASDSGLQVVDITNPAKPIFLSALTNLGSDIKDIVVKNDLAYVALGNAGIGIIDISNPQSPTLISTFATKTGLFGSASSIDVSGDYAYVATGDSIQVINISNPDDPSFTTKINIDRTIFCLDGVRHVKVLEDKVYAGLHCGAELYVDWVIPWWPLKATGLYISDISNPTSPGEPEPVEKVSSFVRSMAVSDTSIYVSSGTDFYIISHPNPGIREVSGPFYASSLIESIAYKNEKLYVGTRGVGIEIYAAEYLSKDKENSSPSTESFIVTPDEMTDIQVLDDTIFVTNKNTIDNQHGNLIIYNQLRANQPVFSDNRVDTPGFAHTVSILNNSVYIADGRSGLQIASIDENKRMTLSTKGKDTDGYSYDLLIDAPFIYLSDGFNGTKIYTPNEEFGPLEVGSISPPKFTLFNLIIAKIEASVLSGKLAKKGNIIFTGQFPGLDIIDVSQPDAPISIDSSTFDGEFVGGTQFLVNGDIGYALVNTLAFSDGTLPGSLIKDVPSFQIYDLQNPASPTRIGFIDIQDFPADVRSIAVNGNYAFVACGIDGIRVVNTADKTAPYVVHALDTPGTAMDVLIDQNILYLATNTHGLAIYDISNPVDLKLLGTAETAGLATGLTFHEDSIFVATGNTGVMQLNKIKLPQ